MLLSQGRFQGLLVKPKAKELPPGFLGLKTWEKHLILVTVPKDLGSTSVKLGKGTAMLPGL